MGATFSTIQVRLPKRMNKEEAKDFLCKGFAKRDYVICEEEDAEFSCWVKLHESGKWLSIGSGEFFEESAGEEAGQLARCLHTCCICTMVMDSDFFIMTAIDMGKEGCSTLAGGDFPLWGENEEIVNKEIWEGLFAEGKGLEDYENCLQQDYTFIEDVLEDVAVLFEMDADAHGLSYDCTEAYPDSGEDDIIELHFMSE